MPPKDQEPEENKFLLARFGPQVEPRDIEAAGGILRSLGFEPQIVTQTELNTLTNLLMPINVVYVAENSAEQNTEFNTEFTSITNRDEFLVQEHFVHYRQLRPDLPQGIVLKAYSHMIDCNPSNASKAARRAGREVVNPLPGIEVKTDRTQVGYPPHPKSLDKYGTANWFRNYAIRAGSIVAAAKCLEASPSLTQRELVIIAMASQLNFQFE